LQLTPSTNRDYNNNTHFLTDQKYIIMSALADKIKGNWNQMKGKLKEEYAELTDDDLLYEDGQEDQLLGRLQKATGKTKDQVKDWIDKF